MEKPIQLWGKRLIFHYDLVGILVGLCNIKAFILQLQNEGFLLKLLFNPIRQKQVGKRILSVAFFVGIVCCTKLGNHVWSNFFIAIRFFFVIF